MLRLAERRRDTCPATPAAVMFANRGMKNRRLSTTDQNIQYIDRLDKRSRASALRQLKDQGKELLLVHIALKSTHKEVRMQAVELIQSPTLLAGIATWKDPVPEKNVDQDHHLPSHRDAKIEAVLKLREMRKYTLLENISRVQDDSEISGLADLKRRNLLTGVRENRSVMEDQSCEGRKVYVKIGWTPFAQEYLI